MLKKLLIKAAAAAVCIFGAMCFSLSASATTVDDVAAVARSYGYPEEFIMQGYNKYYEDPSLWTSEDFDEAINYLNEAGQYIATTGAWDPNGFERTTTAAPATTTAQSSGGAGTVTSTPASGSSSGETIPTDITVTMPDGSTFTRMSREEFIALSYDDKMAYLRTFTQAQQQAFIDNLSPEEYRSLLQQAPVDKKADVVDKLSQAAQTMGMSATVEEIGEDKVSVGLRDENGNLLGVASAGVIVEDTGYDRSGIFKIAAILFLSAVAGVIIVIKSCMRIKDIENENG